MKTKIAAFVVMALVTTNSFAENSLTATVANDESISSQGFRVSILKPTLDTKTTNKYQNFSFDGTSKPDSAIGLSVGYAKLPVQELGFTTNLALIEAKFERSANIARLDGNLGYAFNKFVNLKGGLNVMKFTSGGEVIEDLNPGFGYQASLGFQLNQNVGLDVGFTEQNTSGTSPITVNGQQIGKADVDVKMSGLEIGLNATF